MKIKQQFRIAGPWLTLLVSLLALCLPGRVAAQLDRGEVTGTVEDPTSAVVQKASIALINDDTTARTTTKSTATGTYVFDDVLPGNYTVEAEAPGFQKYVSSASLDQITQFYKDKLNAAGWSLLPGIEPQGGKATLKYVQNQKDGRGRFAVIQMVSENSQTIVVVQSAYTKKPIVIDAAPAPGAVPATQIPVATPGSGSQGETPQVSASLPADLPQYPGAAVTVKTDPMVVLMTVDSPEKVIAFYNQAMVKVGFTLANSMPTAEITTLTWTRDQLQVIVVVMQQGSSTQIVLSAQQK